MLEIKNLKKSYDGVTILHDINLTIEDGEIVSILGPSGCGKTTLLNLILGLTDADEGAILFQGENVLDVPMEQLRADIKREVIDAIVPKELMRPETKIFINPTGRFVIGGPQGDSGLTGRKIIVDTYGGMGRHGGGAFSGKDPTKVDRSAAYAARYVAKNIVAAKLARKCEVQLAYAIGVAKPVSINVNTFGTGKVADEVLEQAVEKVFDLRPTAIIRSLDLRRPIYRKLAAYGHMGREDLGVNWEKTDKVDALLAVVK